jgi:hypothetical protein
MLAVGSTKKKKPVTVVVISLFSTKEVRTKFNVRRFADFSLCSIGNQVHLS